jgi:predicted secreted protein
LYNEKLGEIFAMNHYFNGKDITLEKRIGNTIIVLFVSLLIAISVIFLGCSKDTMTLTNQVKTYTHNETTIQVFSGEQFTIALPSGRIVSNYDWQAEYDTNFLRLVDVQYKEQFFDENDPSSGGLRLFTFQTTATGETFIYMTYIEIMPDQTPKVVDEKTFNIYIGISVSKTDQ